MENFFSYFRRINTVPNKIVVILLLLSAAIATAVPYVWDRINTGAQWQGVTTELSYDAMFYYARANDVTRGHFFVTNPYYFEHRTEPAAIPSADDVFIALPQLLGFSFNVGYYANIFFWSVLLLFLCYVLFCALGLAPLLSLLGTLWCYIGVYGGMLRPGSMQIIFPLYALFLLFFWRYLNKKDTSIFPLAIIAGIAPYFYIHLFMIIGATLGVYTLALLFGRRWRDIRQICLLGAVVLVIMIPHAIQGFSLAVQPFYWEALAHNALLYSHWPQIEAYYYGRWIVLALLLVSLLRRYYPEHINQTTHFFVMCTGLGLALAMVSNIFTGRDFEIAVHVARFSIFWYLMIGILLCVPVHALLFRTEGAWAKRIPIIFLFVLLSLQMLVNLDRSIPHFSLMKEQSVEAESYAGVLDWLQQQPEGVVTAPEDLNSYIPTLTKQYVLYNAYGGHFSVSDDENQERLLLYHSFDHLTEGEFIKEVGGYYGPVPSYLAKTSALRYRLCVFARIAGSCTAPKAEQSFMDNALIQKKFEAYHTNLTVNIGQEYLKYHVRYIVSKIGDTRMSGNIPSCTPVYQDQWFEVCAIAQSF